MSEAHIWDRLARRYDTVVRLFDSSYGQVRERLDRDGRLSAADAVRLRELLRSLPSR